MSTYEYNLAECMAAEALLDLNRRNSDDGDSPTNAAGTNVVVSYIIAADVQRPAQSSSEIEPASLDSDVSETEVQQLIEPSTSTTPAQNRPELGTSNSGSVAKMVDASTSTDDQETHTEAIQAIPPLHQVLQMEALLKDIYRKFVSSIVPVKIGNIITNDPKVILESVRNNTVSNSEHNNTENQTDSENQENDSGLVQDIEAE